MLNYIAKTNVSHVNSIECAVYNGAVCDMIRSLRALNVFNKPTMSRSFGFHAMHRRNR